jgi:hypothetical protein
LSASRQRCALDVFFPYHVAVVEHGARVVINTVRCKISAPSKTNASQLDNPTRVTANPRHGTEPYA